MGDVIKIMVVDDEAGICRNVEKILTKSINRLSKRWGMIRTDDKKNPIVHGIIIHYLRSRLMERPGKFRHFLNLLITTLDTHITAVLQGKSNLKNNELQKILSHAEGLCDGEFWKMNLLHIFCANSEE